MITVDVKSCVECGQQKPRASFYTRAKALDGLHDSCRLCVRSKTNLRDGMFKVCYACGTEKPIDQFNKRNDRRHYAECKSCYAPVARKSRMKMRYGLSVEQYEAMCQAQGGLCAICDKAPSGRGKLVVDHKHETGAVRGLLCDHCNFFIGNAKESIATLKKAIDYLTVYS